MSRGEDDVRGSPGVCKRAAANTNNMNRNTKDANKKYKKITI